VGGELEIFEELEVLVHYVGEMGAVEKTNAADLEDVS
jgi:hypothetical protein